MTVPRGVDNASGSVGAKFGAGAGALGADDRVFGGGAAMLDVELFGPDFACFEQGQVGLVFTPRGRGGGQGFVGRKGPMGV